MKLNLTTWQRLMLAQIVGALEGPVARIRKASKLLDLLELPQGDREAIGLREIGAGAFRWDDTERRWEIEIPDRELAAFLRRQVEAFQHWPAAKREEVLDLCEQLEIGEEEVVE